MGSPAAVVLGRQRVVVVLGRQRVVADQEEDQKAGAALQAVWVAAVAAATCRPTSSRKLTLPLERPSHHHSRRTQPLPPERPSHRRSEAEREVQHPNETAQAQLPRRRPCHSLLPNATGGCSLPGREAVVLPSLILAW